LIIARPPYSDNLISPLLCNTGIVEIFSGLFNRIEQDPIAPNGRPILFAGQFNGGAAVVFITIVIVRIRNAIRHFGSSFYCLNDFRSGFMVVFSLVDCLNARLTWVIVRSGQTVGIFLKTYRLDWINEKVLNLFR
jgi:hypothetical protein